MKRWLPCGLIVILSSTIHAYTGFGVCNFGKETVSSVICYGPAVLKQTTINGDIKVTGSLKAANISARSMQVTGDVNIRNSQISGPVNITGTLSADYMEFNKGVALTGDKIILNHSKINGLLTMTSSSATPYLQLKCSSLITGSVLFDDKAGVIQITGDSSVQGKIVNGAMEFIKPQCN